MISDILEALIELSAEDNRTVFPCSSAPELFFAPDSEQKADRVRREAAAQEICITCPVMLGCGAIARRFQELGIWGGETEEERSRGGYKPKPRLRRRNKTPVCGTEGGYQKHRKDKTEYCERCRAAHRVKRQEDLAKQRLKTGRAKRELARCGTYAAWRRHKRRKEVLDPACLAAIKAYNAGRTEQRREARKKEAA